MHLKPKEQETCDNMNSNDMKQKWLNILFPQIKHTPTLTVIIPPHKVHHALFTWFTHHSTHASTHRTQGLPVSP